MVAREVCGKTRSRIIYELVSENLRKDYRLRRKHSEGIGVETDILKAKSTTLTFQDKLTLINKQGFASAH